MITSAMSFLCRTSSIISEGMWLKDRVAISIYSLSLTTVAPRPPSDLRARLKSRTDG